MYEVSSCRPALVELDRRRRALQWTPGSDPWQEPLADCSRREPLVSGESGGVRHGFPVPVGGASSSGAATCGSAGPMDSMDHVDRKILAELQKDGRQTITELSEMVPLEPLPLSAATSGTGERRRHPRLPSGARSGGAGARLRRAGVCDLVQGGPVDPGGLRRSVLPRSPNVLHAQRLFGDPGCLVRRAADESAWRTEPDIHHRHEADRRRTPATHLNGREAQRGTGRLAACVQVAVACSRPAPRGPVPARSSRPWPSTGRPHPARRTRRRRRSGTGGTTGSAPFPVSRSGPGLTARPIPSPDPRRRVRPGRHCERVGPAPARVRTWCCRSRRWPG